MRKESAAEKQAMNCSRETFRAAARLFGLAQALNDVLMYFDALLPFKNYIYTASFSTNMERYAFIMGRLPLGKPLSNIQRQSD